MTAPGPAAPSAPISDLEAARRVITTEADALRSLAQSLDQPFSAAVDLLLGVQGRVIVSGMGKSGHISAKIVATFASTGTPAQFVHPGEASHGDLGMITTRDVVMMLSNSGETKELADMIHHTRRRSIPLIGMASRAESALLRAADVALVLPPAEEACPMGLAPTTSTTMMLALGDALAVALMERRGFGRDEYKDFHPGGSLGQSLMKVRDLMHRGEELPLAPEHIAMSEAVAVMSAKRFGCVGAVDGQGLLTGIVTDGDLRRRFGEPIATRALSDIMSANPRVVRADALVSEALALMNRGPAPVTALFVVEGEDRRPVGLLHVHDCLKAGFT